MEFLAIVIAIILMVIFWRIFIAIGGFLLAFAVLFIFILLQGCAETDPLVSEWNYNATVENYHNCMAAYDRAGMPTIHRGHTHSYPQRVKLHHLQQDLADNRCRRILGGLWVDRL